MIVIDYVDGRARTERICDSSGSQTTLATSPSEATAAATTTTAAAADSTSSSTSASPGQRPSTQYLYPGLQYGNNHEITIHQRHLHGSFVDSSASNSSTSINEDNKNDNEDKSQPPPPPPRTYHNILHQGQQQYYNSHHRQPPPVPPTKSGKLRNSHSSDSSSAYSGSDTMQSMQSSSVDADGNVIHHAVNPHPQHILQQHTNNRIYYPSQQQHQHHLQPSAMNQNGVINEVDLSGLMESVVDSDEEEETEESSLIVRDAVRECLEKDPSDRGEEDIDVLLEFTQHLKAFTNMTMSVRRALVASMVFAVVEKAGTVVMTDGEELDSWSVIINGCVEIQETQNSKSFSVRELHLGDAFGITPTMEKLYHKGVMRTKCDDCQFVCVTQTDYYRILHQGEEAQRRHVDEDGNVVLVTEHRAPSDDLESQPHRRGGHVVIRGTADKLMAQLMEDNSNVDPTFVEDFLLTYRTFLDSPVRIMEQLLTWFRDENMRDKVTRVLLLWVNNHFTDFETDPLMMEHLEKFELALEGEKMYGQLRMLNFACAAKARKRTVTLTRPSRDEPLQFSITGGYEKGCGIFISRVEKGSKPDEIGLKRGDQILEVNGQSFEHVTKLIRAMEILKGVCHLSITVKSNLLAFNEILLSPVEPPTENGGGSQRPTRSRGKSVGGGLSNSRPELEGKNSTASLGDQSVFSGSESVLSYEEDENRGSGSREATPKGSNRTSKFANNKTSSSSSSKASRLNRAFNRFLHKPKSLVSVADINNLDTSHEDGGVGGYLSPNASRRGRHNSSKSGKVNNASAAHSNPDLSNNKTSNGNGQTSGGNEETKSEFPEHVLKVYKADQTFKYLLVHKETTAHEVVMLSLQEFGIVETSSNFTLCEVSVAEGGFVKQRRLPDALQNLAERIGLASRYYIKNVTSSESLLPDDAVSDLVKESVVNLLQLNPVEVSTQLMVEDFTIFRQIEATEYVEDLFEIKSCFGVPNLSQFSELVNREMMWTITEVVSEPNVAKRMRVVKQYIKVARQCKETQNFNSMFAIISGLGHGAVSRLKSTWEKLPTKYQRMFNEMQQLMDPSRNMSRYRNLVCGEDVQPPIIPFYPIVKKDLTFIHLANDSRAESMVNFEKLRMIAKEVRTLTNMCSAPLDLFSMLELGGQQPSNAMVAMNQLTAGGQYLATVNRTRRNKKTGGVPNPKRMFEEAQMVRRVKAYLNNMKVITDEDRLHQMSSECESSASGGGGVGLVGGILLSASASASSNLLSQSFSNSSSTTTQQNSANARVSSSPSKRASSPSPSALSSTNSSSNNNNNNNSHNHSISNDYASKSRLHQSLTGKFGASSPQAVKKLLSLSESSSRGQRPKSSSGGMASPFSSRKSTEKTEKTSPTAAASASGGGSSIPGFVDLSPESSSVTTTTVPFHIPRKVQQITGSSDLDGSALSFESSDRSNGNAYSSHHKRRNSAPRESALRRQRKLRSAASPPAPLPNSGSAVVAITSPDFEHHSHNITQLTSGSKYPTSSQPHSMAVPNSVHHTPRLLHYYGGGGNNGHQGHHVHRLGVTSSHHHSMASSPPPRPPPKGSYSNNNKNLNLANSSTSRPATIVTSALATASASSSARSSMINKSSTSSNNNGKTTRRIPSYYVTEDDDEDDEIEEEEHNVDDDDDFLRTNKSLHEEKKHMKEKNSLNDGKEDTSTQISAV